MAATHVQIQDPTYICAFSLFNPTTQDPINSYYYSPLEIDSDIQFLKFMRWNQAKVAVYAFSHSGSCLFTRGTSALLSLSLCLISCTHFKHAPPVLHHNNKNCANTQQLGLPLQRMGARRGAGGGVKRYSDVLFIINNKRVLHHQYHPQPTATTSHVRTFKEFPLWL